MYADHQSLKRKRRNQFNEKHPPLALQASIRIAD
jgi:hypothetical protein